MDKTPHTSDDPAMALSPETCPTLPVKKRTRSLYSVLLWIGLGIIGVVVAISQHALHQTQQALQAMQRLQHQQHNQLTSLQSTLQKIILSSTELNEKFQQTDQKLKYILNEQSYQDRDWQLHKARYLIELAQANAQWTLDPATSLALYNQADTLLTHFNDRDLNIIRESIEHNRSILQHQPTLPIHVISDQLQHLQKKIAALQYPPRNHTLASPPLTAPAQSWRDTLNKSMQQIKELVVVHHYDAETRQALFMPDTHTWIMEQLDLDLQQAQVALLNQQQALYTLLLNNVEHTLQTYFVTQRPSIEPLLNELHQLLSKPISTPRPPLIDVLPMLDAYIQQPKPLAAQTSPEVQLK